MCAGVLREQEATKQILQLFTVQELADGFNPHSTEVGKLNHVF